MNTEKLYEEYARKFNALSNKLQKANIDINLLHEVVGAAVELHNFKMGLHQGKETHNGCKNVV